MIAVFGWCSRWGCRLGGVSLEAQRAGKSLDRWAYGCSWNQKWVSIGNLVFEPPYTHLELPDPNSPTVPLLLIVRWEERVLCESSSTSAILSITTSHCSLGRGIALWYETQSPFSSSNPWCRISGGFSLRVATFRGDPFGKVSACCRSRWIRSTFFPLALMECILHNLTSCSRLRECNAGELNKIWVVVDIMDASGSNWVQSGCSTRFSRARDRVFIPKSPLDPTILLMASLSSAPRS